MPWPRDWRMVVAFSGVRAEKTREALEKYNMASRRVRDSVRRFNALAGTRLATLREVVDHEPKPGRCRMAAGARTGSDRSGRCSPRPRRPGDAVHPRGQDAHPRAPLPRWRPGTWLHSGSSSPILTRRRRSTSGTSCPRSTFYKRRRARSGRPGASGFGAGFGGSIFAVTTGDRAEALLLEWRAKYAARYPERAGEAAFFIAEPSPGIEVWSESGPVSYAAQVFQA